MTTIHDRVAAARVQLRRAGISSAESDLDSRLLAQHLLEWDAARFFTSANEPEPDGFGSRYDKLVARRASREPVAYIVGHKEFWDLSFEITPAVLIPRPETEIIVEAALEVFPDPSRRLTIVDACTGSGCLAVALAHERPNARVVATDISERALDVARRNARRHGVAARVEFVQGDLLEPIHEAADLIVANPPYVARRDQTALQPEVRDFEPDVALFGGDDGLHVINRLVRSAAGRLRPGGYLMFEFGFGQDEHIERLLTEAEGLMLVGLRRDLLGIARTAIAVRSS